MEFYGLQLTDKMIKRINSKIQVGSNSKRKSSHSVRRDSSKNSKGKSPYSINRDPEFEMQQWRHELLWKDVDTIQQECVEAMDLWGYEAALNGDHVLTFEPLGLFNW